MDESRSRRKQGTTSRARKLRQTGNESEARLWSELKDRQLAGFKFVRQLPIEPYFADFACRDKRLVVEIDGSQHVDSESDRRRDNYMAERGWWILRFWNIDVLKEMTSVCETILAVLDGRLAEPIVAQDLRLLLPKRKAPLTASLRSAPLPRFAGRAIAYG